MIGGTVKKKTVKKTNKIQKGGTLFKIHSDDLDCLQHVGRGAAENISCGACSINQLGFPADIVDELSRTAGRHPAGELSFKIMNQKINEVKNRAGLGGGGASQICLWGANKSRRNKLAAEPYATAMTNLVPMVGQGTVGVFKKAILSVFGILQNGTKNVLGMSWIGGGGHYVSIAKSLEGTPYLIESQHNSCEAVYRDWDRIFEYFSRQSHTAYLITFNNSIPQMRNGRWTIDLDKEIVIDLNTLGHRGIPAEAVNRYVDGSGERQASYASNVEPMNNNPVPAAAAAAPAPTWSPVNLSSIGSQGRPALAASWPAQGNGFRTSPQNSPMFGGRKKRHKKTVSKSKSKSKKKKRKYK